MSKQEKLRNGEKGTNGAAAKGAAAEAIEADEAEIKQEETEAQAVAAESKEASPPSAGHSANGSDKGSSQKRLRRVHTLTALFVVALMCFSLAFHSGLGTPSSFGLSTFNLICPMGGLEVLLASKTLIPRTVISFLVVLFVCLVVGRAWCAWACPVPLTRRVFGIKEAHPDKAACKRGIVETFKSDSRLWVLAGVLIATLVVGLPVFCLVCPVGLTFGTIMSVWRLIQFNDINLGLLVFPAALVVELVLCRKWCVKICPIAALLSLVGRIAKPLRPVVNESSCLHRSGVDCKACLEACPAAIDLHAEDTAAQLADCTRCAECKVVCPTNSIAMPFLPQKRVGGKGLEEASQSSQTTDENKTE